MVQGDGGGKRVAGTGQEKQWDGAWVWGTDLGYFAQNIFSKVTKFTAGEWLQASDHHPNPSHSPSPRCFQSSHGEILKLCSCKEKWEEQLSLEEDRGSCKVFLVPGQFTTHPSLGFSCTISLIPYLHSAIPFYFCTLFQNSLIYVNATNGTQCIYHPQSPRTWKQREPLSCTQKSCCMRLVVIPALIAHLAARLFLRWLFTAAFSQSKAAHRASDRSWGHLAQSCA